MLAALWMHLALFREVDLFRVGRTDLWLAFELAGFW